MKRTSRAAGVIKHLGLFLTLSLHWRVRFRCRFPVYFGAYTSTKSKGIYLSRFDSKTGALTPPDLVAEADNPNFLAVAPNGHFLYSICDGGKQPAGAVNAYALDVRTGKFTLLNQQLSRRVWPSHVAVDASGKCLLAANYRKGSVVALPKRCPLTTRYAPSS